MRIQCDLLSDQQQEDQCTFELPLEVKAKKRGRPPKDDKLSDADRARRYRARQKMLPRDDWHYEQVTAMPRAEVMRLTGDAASRPAGEAELVAHLGLQTRELNLLHFEK